MRAMLFHSVVTKHRLPAPLQCPQLRKAVLLHSSTNTGARPKLSRGESDPVCLSVSLLYVMNWFSRFPRSPVPLQIRSVAQMAPNPRQSLIRGPYNMKRVRSGMVVPTLFGTRQSRGSWLLSNVTRINFWELIAGHYYCDLTDHQGMAEI